MVKLRAELSRKIIHDEYNLARKGCLRIIYYLMTLIPFPFMFPKDDIIMDRAEELPLLHGTSCKVGLIHTVFTVTHVITLVVLVNCPGSAINKGLIIRAHQKNVS